MPRKIGTCIRELWFIIHSGWYGEICAMWEMQDTIANQRHNYHDTSVSGQRRANIATPFSGIWQANQLTQATTGWFQIQYTLWDWHSHWRWTLWITSNCQNYQTWWSSFHKYSFWLRRVWPNQNKEQRIANSESHHDTRWLSSKNLGDRGDTVLARKHMDQGRTRMLEALRWNYDASKRWPLCSRNAVQETNPCIWWLIQTSQTAFRSTRKEIVQKPWGEGAILGIYQRIRRHGSLRRSASRWTW